MLRTRLAVGHLLQRSTKHKQFQRLVRASTSPHQSLSWRPLPENGSKRWLLPPPPPKLRLGKSSMLLHPFVADHVAWATRQRRSRAGRSTRSRHQSLGPCLGACHLQSCGISACQRTTLPVRHFCIHQFRSAHPHCLDLLLSRWLRSCGWRTSCMAFCATTAETLNHSVPLPARLLCSRSISCTCVSK